MVPRSFWLAMWASFTYLTLQPANRSPHSLGSMVSGMADGEPAWIKTIDSSLGQAVNGNGTEISVVFAALFLVVGLGVFVPRLVRPVVAVAAVLGLVIWVVEDFGEIFTSQGTDPSSGLLLALLAAVFWPTAAVRTVPGAAQLRPDPVAV